MTRGRRLGCHGSPPAGRNKLAIKCEARAGGHVHLGSGAGARRPPPPAGEPAPQSVIGGGRICGAAWQVGAGRVGGGRGGEGCGGD